MKFERGIVNGHSTMNLNARAKPNCLSRQTDRQTDRRHHFIDWILLRNPAKKEVLMQNIAYLLDFYVFFIDFLYKLLKEL